MLSEELERILQVKGIAATAMRMRVLEYLHTCGYALSLADIEKGLTHTDRVTVYRTLRTFEEQHMVHRVADGSGVAKYALCSEDCLPGKHHTDLHAHFTCRICGITTCLPGHSVPRLPLPEGYTGEEISLGIRGVCLQCKS